MLQNLDDGNLDGLMDAEQSSKSRCSSEFERDVVGNPTTSHRTNSSKQLAVVLHPEELKMTKIGSTASKRSS